MIPHKLCDQVTPHRDQSCFIHAKQVEQLPVFDAVRNGYQPVGGQRPKLSWVGQGATAIHAVVEWVW